MNGVAPSIIIPRRAGSTWIVQGTDRGILVRLDHGKKVTEALLGADAAERMGAALRQAAQDYRWRVVAQKGDHVGKL